MQPIPYELLVDLAEGRMDQPTAAALRARVAADPVAQAQLASLEVLLGSMRADDSVDAPDHAIRRAVRLMRRSPATPAPSLLQRLSAILKADSWQTAALATGLRSTQAWPRTLLLSAGERDLDLQIGPRDDGWQLSGQVLGPEAQGRVVLSGAGAQVSALLNELGEFVLPPVGAGRYSLLVTHGACEIVVPNLELGPSLR